MAALSLQATSSSSSSSSSSPLRLTSALKIPRVNETIKISNPNDQSQFHKWSISHYHHYPSPTSFKTGVPADSSKFPRLTDEMRYRTEYGVEVKTVRHLLSEIAEEDPLESLNMIDAVQRLGIDYYFREEIEAVLQTHYVMARNPSASDRKSGLHEVALRFRLLRQHGYFVASDMFLNFMDNDGHLNKKLTEDIKGLASLYEASQLCLPGEDKLEKVGKFSAQILETCFDKLDDQQLAHHVTNTLANPFHKSSSNLLVKNYFGFGDQFQASNKWIYALQQMAKMDFNRVQSLHQQEIFQVSQWWRKTGLSEKLKFARDQPLKWYICSLAFLADPRFSEERVDLTKSISFIYLIDDIYDLYGSLDELRLFTEAVRRWDLTATENLPDSMRICYNALHETTNEISYKVYQKHGWNPMDSLKKSWATLCDAFLVEAEWFACGHFPSAEEYLKNGAVSTGVHIVLAHIFFLVGQEIREETVQLLDSNPGIVSSTATILRLRDDLGSAEDENQEGFDGSYIEYYMKENEGISLESARVEVMRMISDAWKRLNQECISPNPFPWTFKEASRNIARFVPLLYGYDENQNLPTLEKLMESVLYERVQF